MVTCLDCQHIIVTTKKNKITVKCQVEEKCGDNYSLFVPVEQELDTGNWIHDLDMEDR